MNFMIVKIKINEKKTNQINTFVSHSLRKRATLTCLPDGYSNNFQVQCSKERKRETGRQKEQREQKTWKNFIT